MRFIKSTIVILTNSECINLNIYLKEISKTDFVPATVKAAMEVLIQKIKDADVNIYDFEAGIVRKLIVQKDDYWVKTLTRELDNIPDNKVLQELLINL